MITMVGKTLNDGAEYFGPYGSRGVTQSVLKTIQSIMKLPGCSRQFPRDIGKDRPCLNYHMNQCAGWCQEAKHCSEYRKIMEQARQLLLGNYKSVAAEIRTQMLGAADDLNFELAAKLRTVDGVVDVAFSDNDVVALGVWVKRTEIKGEQPDGAERVISLRPTFVSRNFLDVMGIPMVESEHNTDAVPYAIILNKAAKERYKITCDNVIPINATEWDIVGFCDDFVSRPMNSDDRTAMGLCFSDSGMNKLFIRIKSDCNVELLVPMIKEVIASYDSNTKADDIVVELYDEKLKEFYNFIVSLQKISDNEASTMADACSLPCSNDWSLCLGVVRGALYGA